MKYVIALLLIMNTALAANFYASQELQAKYPKAFATSHENLHFHQELNQLNDRHLLIHEIQKDPVLLKKIVQFNQLELEEQVQVLRDLFDLECRNLNMTPPELIIDETSIPGYAYFEFDFAQGGPGKVYLNKAKLKSEKNKSDFIILLLHETRHSAQFQLAQKHPSQTLGSGYRAAFSAQKEMKDNGVKTSFCDFMLLLNEFEAFQFSNYVHGVLTGFQTPINDMGTLASQYDGKGNLRMDLIQVLSNPNPVEFFNNLSSIQFEVMYE